MKNTNTFIKNLKTLHKKGLSERAIATKLKCSRGKVYYWLNK